MGTKVENHIDKVLNRGLEKDYWFMTKQTMTDFYFILTIARVVDTYNTAKQSNENFGMYYQRFFNENPDLKNRYPKQAESENTYRNSIIAEFFGLFKREKTSYDSGVVTPAFKVIDKYIKSYSDVNKYRFLIERQIEKLCLNVNDKIQNYNDLHEVKNYPAMFLYKILLELYKKTGDSTLYYDEFVVFVVRALKYSDWVETVDLILEYRQDGLTPTYKNKFDNIYNDVTASNIRFDTLLGTLSNIVYAKKQNRNYYSIKENESSYRYIENAVEIFEASKYSKDLPRNEMQDFLQSDRYFLGYLDVAFVKENEKEGDANMSDNIDESKRIKGGRNIILYGVPGAGKSYTIETEYCKDEDKMERLVFHPDYTYSDFVGQILPSIDESGESKTIQYKFEAGPFTTLLKKAYRDPENKYYLIIEEINRGNAPAIFGDVFQLLDRKPDGTSMYGITNKDIAKIVYDDSNHKVRIPSNMSILCTMNTSDQNVFTLDTAFQRRWNMRLIENTFKENDVLANIKILDSSVTWRVFQETINEIILNTNVRLTSAEDKRLGTHFVVEEDLKYNDKADKGTGQEQIDAKLENRRFAEKVIKYLWDDAFKFNRESLFNVRDNGTNNSLEAIIRSFLGAKGDARFDIFLDNIKRTMIDESKPKDETTGDVDGTSETN